MAVIGVASDIVALGSAGHGFGLGDRNFVAVVGSDAGAAGRAAAAARAGFAAVVSGVVVVTAAGREQQTGAAECQGALNELGACRFHGSPFGASTDRRIQA